MKVGRAFPEGLSGEFPRPYLVTARLCRGLGNRVAKFCSVETFHFKDKKVELQTGDRLKFQNSYHPIPLFVLRLC